MPAAKAKRFHAEILEGHKGAAVIVPFDPAEEWKAKPSAVPAPYKTGHLIKGTLNDEPFEGFIGKRWGRQFILVDAALQKRAGTKAGDVVIVKVSPRTTAAATRSKSKPLTPTRRKKSA